ncbi:DUF1748-domain-containing protein [Calocera viscosa TUFC12733]|uniref:DUF1748-domain-containing protein n=1 Tax=Calocera viscosa (strain TUFC12733) TaxID=1330018 RepID=A0A167J4E9_CALVF|nr:DUF1748-domain-containing protein [Calocera viscosa TUFC12733]
MFGLGKLFHYAFDAVLLSAFLAGVRRSTGLTPALALVPNKDIRQLLRSYLELGEAGPSPIYKDIPLIGV